MFIENKYYRWYLGITAEDDISGVTEKHHRIPRSMGGTNDKSNLVRLTLRKHFLAHWLLTKCTAGIDQKKMLKALGFMTGNRKTRISSWQFEAAKKAAIAGRKGDPSPMKGKKHRQESLALMSIARKGKKLSEEHKENISLGGTGRIFSEETCEKIAARKRGVKLSTSHCQSIGDSKRGTISSLETRQKVSLSLIGNTRSVGRVHPAETRSKMGMSHRENPNAQSNNKLGLKGVVRHPGGRFRVRTKFSGKYINIGIFDCPVAAHLAYIVTNDALMKGISP